MESLRELCVSSGGFTEQKAATIQILLQASHFSVRARLESLTPRYIKQRGIVGAGLLQIDGAVERQVEARAVAFTQQIPQAAPVRFPRAWLGLADVRKLAYSDVSVAVRGKKWGGKVGSTRRCPDQRDWPVP